MVTFHFIRFFCLTAVLVRFDCLQRLQLNRITRSKTSVTAISTRRLEIGSILTRAASLIVGSTIPFLFQLDFGGIDQEHLTFQSSPQCAHADSTGKVNYFDAIIVTACAALKLKWNCRKLILETRTSFDIRWYLVSPARLFITDSSTHFADLLLLLSLLLIYVKLQMSTKLTARKRYLPRVKAGVTEFKKLSQVCWTWAL